MEAAVAGTATGASRRALVDALTTEAQRVGRVRHRAAASGRSLPHAERAPGCAAFLALPTADREHLVDRLTVLPGSFRLSDVEGQVIARVLRGYVRSTALGHVAVRLVGWWEREVALALLGRRPRRITRDELSGAVSDLVTEHGVV